MAKDIYNCRERGSSLEGARRPLCVLTPPGNWAFFTRESAFRGTPDNFAVPSFCKSAGQKDRRAEDRGQKGRRTEGRRTEGQKGRRTRAGGRRTRAGGRRTEGRRAEGQKGRRQKDRRQKGRGQRAKGREPGQRKRPYSLQGIRPRYQNAGMFSRIRNAGMFGRIRQRGLFGLAVGPENVDDLVHVELLHLVASRPEVLPGIELARFLGQDLADRSRHSETRI
jgi:hypothetical protein